MKSELICECNTDNDYIMNHLIEDNSYKFEIGNMHYIVSSHFNTQAGKTLQQILSELIVENIYKNKQRD